MSLPASTAVQVGLQIAEDVDIADCPDQESFQRWVAAALQAADLPVIPSGVLSIRLLGSEESAALNREFRGKDMPTNVLAFPAAPSLIPAAETPEAELGDLAVCLVVARQEAREQAKTLPQHLAHLTVHGTLHLLGYDHYEDAEAERMESAERCALEQLGLPDPYRGVAGGAGEL